MMIEDFSSGAYGTKNVLFIMILLFASAVRDFFASGLLFAQNETPYAITLCKHPKLSENLSAY